MDFRSLQEHRDKLEHELLTLKGYPLEVPMVTKLIESEITRLNKTLLSMRQDNVHVYADGRILIDHVSNEFGLIDVSSMLSLSTKLMEELSRIKPPLIRIAIFTQNVFQRLHQEVMKELDNVTFGAVPTASTSQEPKPALDDSQSQVFLGSLQQPDDIFARKNLEWCIGCAIDTTMHANPLDISVDQITKLLQQTAINVNVDDEDVKRLIYQKCEDAIQARNKE